MIRRLRCRAGLCLSVGLVLAGWTLAATATQPVTRSEMEAFVYLSLAGSGAFVILGGAGVFAWILKRDRDLQRLTWDARAETFEAQIKTLIDDCAHHHCALGARDPHDSPSVRRSSDPEGFDGRPERGRG